MGASGSSMRILFHISVIRDTKISNVQENARKKCMDQIEKVKKKSFNFRKLWGIWETSITASAQQPSEDSSTILVEISVRMRKKHSLVL